MQILKEEMREGIIQVAEQEFLKRGFKEASMRTIAKKASTTQGNLYNYFKSKEALLEEVVGDIPGKIEQLFHEHEEPLVDLVELSTWDEEKFEGAFEQLGFEYLIGKPFIILMEGCAGTRYEAYRRAFIDMGKHHLLEHLGNSKKEKLAEMLSVSFLEAVLFIGKSQSSLEEGKKTFLEYCNLFILGMLKNQAK